MFLAPGVTPWKTTLPGVNNGANNPGIRVIDYDADTLQVQVEDPLLLCTAVLEEYFIPPQAELWDPRGFTGSDL